MLKIGLVLTLFFTFIFGGVYSALIYFIGDAFFPFQSRGSLLFDPENQTLIGSKWIAQDFTQAQYFIPRPSKEKGAKKFNGTYSGGTELAPTSKKLIDAILQRAEKYREFNDLPSDTCIPIDAVTVSASDLDPHISTSNALLQAPRVAKARNLSEEEMLAWIQKFTERPFFSFIGEPRINVLMLNLALDHTQFEKEE